MWRSRTPTYKSWISMKSRCLVPTSTGYSLYGGRGIKICERWMVYENFLEDMGHRPLSHTLDRIDVNGNYEPSNCRWATAKQQAENRRMPIIMVDGIADTLTNHCKRKNFKRSTAARRLTRMWQPNDLFLPPQRKGVNHGIQ